MIGEQYLTKYFSKAETAIKELRGFQTDPSAFLMNLEETETETPETKARKKKKMTAAALKKMQARAAEEAKQQVIRQKQEYLKEIKKRVQTEWDLNHAKALVYENEFQERQKLLLNSSAKLAEIQEAWEEYNQEQKKLEEWLQYMKCDRLPNPSSLSEMNSYIFVWTELDSNNLMSHCIKKTEEVMKLLKGLEKILSDPRYDHPAYFLKDIKGIRNEMRYLLQEHIDRATFYLFSRIESDMVSINVTNSKYFVKCQHFLMSLWAELITPIPSSHGKQTRNPLKVVFEETEITVILPVSLLDIHMVMRAMWLNYDHWSDKCRTYDCPSLPSYYMLSLYDLFLSEHDTKIEIMNYREHLEAVTKKKITSIPTEPTLSQEIIAWACEPQRALSDEIIFRECEEEDNLGRQVKTILNEFEVNLRERKFLGSLLLLEVLHQPPQAKLFRFKHSVTLRKEPPHLIPVDFYVRCPHAVKKLSSEHGDQPAEENRTKLPEPPSHLEEEKKKLLAVQLKPCQSVLWFEQPQLATWDPIRGYWSTEDIHDTTMDEEDGTISFRTGRLGLMGLHVHRYCHLPYQDWLFEANDERGVNFFLKTAKSDLFFRIMEGKVCLKTMENVPSKAMNWILGNYYPPAELMEKMKAGGIDVFPAPDATSYIEDVQSKHFVVERNIYQVWGLFSRTFRFKRSKFNQLADRKNIVFQAQEIYKNHQVDFCLIQTAMCSSYVLDINEDSDYFSPEKAPYSETCVDLLSLLLNNSTKHARRRADATCFLLVQTVKEFLEYIRPISFS